MQMFKVTNNNSDFIAATINDLTYSLGRVSITIIIVWTFFCLVQFYFSVPPLLCHMFRPYMATHHQGTVSLAKVAALYVLCILMN